MAPRPGYHSVTPRIVVGDVAAQAEFLRRAFHATGELNRSGPTEMRVGDSLIMVSEASERAAFPSFLYVYVDDAEAAYARAMRAGATSLEDPRDTPYGDRRAMVRDPWGNVFQIAHPVS